MLANSGVGQSSWKTTRQTPTMTLQTQRMTTETSEQASHVRSYLKRSCVRDTTFNMTRSSAFWCTDQTPDQPRAKHHLRMAIGQGGIVRLTCDEDNMICQRSYDRHLRSQSTQPGRGHTKTICSLNGTCRDNQSFLRLSAGKRQSLLFSTQLPNPFYDA